MLPSIPSRSPQNCEYFCFSDASSIITSNRLPVLLRACIDVARIRNKKEESHRIVEDNLILDQSQASLGRRVPRQDLEASAKVKRTCPQSSAHHNHIITPTSISITPLPISHHPSNLSLSIFQKCQHSHASSPNPSATYAGPLTKNPPYSTP